MTHKSLKNVMIAIHSTSAYKIPLAKYIPKYFFMHTHTHAPYTLLPLYTCLHSTSITTNKDLGANICTKWWLCYLFFKQNQLCLYLYLLKKVLHTKLTTNMLIFVTFLFGTPAHPRQRRVTNLIWSSIHPGNHWLSSIYLVLT